MDHAYLTVLLRHVRSHVTWYYIYRTLGRTTESAKERTRIRAKARTPRLEIFSHKFHFLKFSPFFVLDYFDQLFKKFSFCRNFKSLKLYLSYFWMIDVIVYEGVTNFCSSFIVLDNVCSERFCMQVLVVLTVVVEPQGPRQTF